MKPSNTTFETQQSAQGSIRPLKRHQLRIKKVVIAAFTLLIALQSFAWPGPDIKATLQQTFQQNFPNAENVAWSNDADSYTVSFTVKSILTRITYDRKGKFTGSLRNYTEQMLPFYITNMLKQKYPGNEVFGVTEITSPTDINYFVKMEGAKHWLTVRIDNDGNSYIVERYKKQK